MRRVRRRAADDRHRGLSERSLTDATGGARILVTSEARLSIQFAREEAKRLGQPAVGTEHILLGILRCRRSHAVRALSALGVTHRTASSCLHTTLPGVPIDDDAAEEQHGDGVSAHARLILEGSLREALNHGDGYIGVEHLLLALLTDSRNGAVQTLEALHATPTKIKAQLEREWQKISRTAEAQAAAAPAATSRAVSAAARTSSSVRVGADPGDPLA